MTTSAEIRQHLVDALRIDLIGPSWDDVARRHEQLSQPPSVWYTTGFLVPHVFQQEAGRTTTTKEEQPSLSCSIKPPRIELTGVTTFLAEGARYPAAHRLAANKQGQVWIELLLQLHLLA